MFGFGSKKVQINDSLTDNDVKQMLSDHTSIKRALAEHTAKVVDTQMIVIVTLNGKGQIHAQYAGNGADITAVSLLMYGVRIIQDGKSP